MASTISREAERSAGALSRSADPSPSLTTAPPRPRIAHVVTRYLRGGSEKRVRDMVAAYPEADHHLILGAESDVSLAQREVAPARLEVLRSLARRPDPWRDGRALRGLERILREGSFELVITHQAKAGALGRAAARRLSIPTIHSLSMAYFGEGYPRWQDRLFRTIETRLAAETMAFAVVGSDLARRYAALGVPEDRLHVVRSGVPLPAEGQTFPSTNRLRRTFGLPTGRPVILYLGSLEPRKNVLDLPRYLAGVCGRLDDDRRPFLAVAGEGPLVGRLRARLERTHGDAAVLGYVPEPLPLIRAADLLVLLSSAEGMCQALVQATALGTPFVAYDVDGVRELIGLGAPGTAVPLGDVEAAAAASAEVLRTGRPDRIPIDLSTWSPTAIAEGYRRLISTALGSATGIGPSADRVAVAS